MVKAKSNKTILYIFVAVVLFLSVIVVNEICTYNVKAAEVPQQVFVEGNASDYDFKIMPTASIDMETLDDSDNNTVGLIFNSSMLTSKYVESDMVIEAYLVDKSREINLANCAVGLTPYKSTKETVDDRTAFHAAFYISRANYSIEYRCIWVLKSYEDKRAVICIADFTDLKTDFSVMKVASTIVNTADSGISDHYQIKLKELINNVNSENQVKKDMDDLKKAGKVLLEDSGFKKIIAVVCGSFLLLCALSVFTTFFMRKGR